MSAEPLAAMILVARCIQSLDAGAEIRVAEFHQCKSFKLCATNCERQRPSDTNSCRARAAGELVESSLHTVRAFQRYQDARAAARSGLPHRCTRARAVAAPRRGDRGLAARPRAARLRAPSTQNRPVARALLRARSLHACTLSRRETMDPRAGPERSPQITWPPSR